MPKEDEIPSEFPFDPEASYEDMEVVPPTYVPWPEIVPELDLNGLPVYETSSDEDVDEEENEVYQNGYNYIDNFYK